MWNRKRKNNCNSVKSLPKKSKIKSTHSQNIMKEHSLRIYVEDIKIVYFNFNIVLYYWIQAVFHSKVTGWQCHRVSSKMSVTRKMSQFVRYFSNSVEILDPIRPILLTLQKSCLRFNTKNLELVMTSFR